VRKWDEATSWAIAFENTCRKKRPKDLVTVAEAMEYLTGLYGSKAVARKLNLSVEMVRQFLTVLDLPRIVKKLFASRQIDSVDIAKELYALGNKKKQETVAKTIVNSPSKDVRDIKRLIKNRNFGVETAKRTVLDAKPKGLNIFVLDLDDKTSQKIVSEAIARKMKPAELVRQIIANYLKKRRPQKS
jgi:ParB-like chromosome segregation protein Spo0J